MLDGQWTHWLLRPSVAMIVGVCVLTLLLAHTIAACLAHARDKRIQKKLQQLAATSGRKIPVTIVTGFLGSGKTQLLNRILAAPQGHRIIVIENEVGAVSIDHALLKAGAEGTPSAGVYVLANGCMCCSSGGAGDELERTLDQLLRNNGAAGESGEPRFDYVVVETSGLADPIPIIETFFRDDLGGRYFIDSVVTVVDAKNIAYHLDGHGYLSRERESGRQVAVADVVLLNKVDIASPEEIARATAAIRHTNPVAQVLECTYADVDPTLLLDRRAFVGADAFAQLTASISEAAGDATVMESQRGKHDNSVRAITLTSSVLDSGVPIHSLQSWLQTIVNRKWKNIYRIKGLVRAIPQPEDVTPMSRPPQPEWFVFHGVHAELHGSYLDEIETGLTPVHAGSASASHACSEACRHEEDSCTAPINDSSPPSTAEGSASLRAAIVIIGPDLPEEEIRASFRAEVGAPHGDGTEDAEADSVSNSGEVPSGPSAAHLRSRPSRRRTASHSQ